MKVLFASAECAPFFKTGGLGDVAGALPKALATGAEVSVVLPYISQIPDVYRNQCEDICDFTVAVGWRQQYCGIKRLIIDEVTYYFIDNHYYFERPNLYGYYDDGERFAFFSLAIIEMMEKIPCIPDVIHVNDFHTAMIPFLLKEKYHWIEAYRSIRSVLTIHNIEFQGRYSEEMLADLFGMGRERFDDGTIRFGHGINFLKAGILYADRITTVSPSYAHEIQTAEFGSGLDDILRMEKDKLSGILNGIDYQLNNPETDPLIPYHFSIENNQGKADNKIALQQRLNLPVNPTIPVIGMVSRLTYQKGFQLIVDEMTHLLKHDVQIVVLGTGDERFETAFTHFAGAYPEKVSAAITFDLQLAQLIYAGADMFLMPSAFEPCGLSQMIAMRYGTLPIVHEVGGLRDTVEPYNPLTKQGTGFGFQDYHPFYLMHAIKTGLQLYQSDQGTWKKLMHDAMTKDFSWATSSQLYLSVYQDITTHL